MQSVPEQAFSEPMRICRPGQVAHSIRAPLALLTLAVRCTFLRARGRRSSSPATRPSNYLRFVSDLACLDPIFLG